MPFILSPNFSKLINSSNVLKKERIHNDGITYDLNSPEALDEVFFNTDDEFIKNELINYFQLICLSENKMKYLSKNNWNLMDLYKIKPELVHHDPTHFKNRYTVQSWNKPGSYIGAINRWNDCTRGCVTRS